MDFDRLALGKTNNQRSNGTDNKYSPYAVWYLKNVVTTYEEPVIQKTITKIENEHERKREPQQLQGK
jgi:hypothetical protein